MTAINDCRTQFRPSFLRRFSESTPAVIVPVTEHDGDMGYSDAIASSLQQQNFCSNHFCVFDCRKFLLLRLLVTQPELH